jgi:hypothetical protein
MSRASEARQDEHTWVIRILRSDIFLGDEVHAVTQRGYEPSTRGAIEPGERPSGA